MDEMQEILEDFLIEAFEMIEQLDQDLIELEHNPSDLDLLNRIFRVAHTIKGSSSFLNFDILTNLTHNMEDVLNKARRGELVITPNVMDVVLESIDLMKGLLTSIRDTGSDKSDIEIDDVVKRLQNISQGNKQEAKEEVKDTPSPQINKLVDNNEASKVESTTTSAFSTDSNNKIQDNLDTKNTDSVDYSNFTPDEIEKEIERLLKQRQEEDKERRLKKKQEEINNSQINPPKVEQTTTQKSTTKQNLDSKVKKQQGAKKDDTAVSTSLEQTVRVDVKRLDHLMNLIGELVLGKNRLISIYDEVEERYDGEQFLEELNQVVSAISIVTTDLQLAVMKTRMLPVSKVFNKFPRMVRDLSRDMGKNIELIISGEETELDKSIVEEIGDPLVHIIRNSCDHGIESKEDRLAEGKSEIGKIELKAYNEGNHIVVEVADDGKGLDADLLKQKALEKGIINDREADTMTNKEAYSLIFKAGFSTAKVVTNVSGRGVGMDVVKTNIEKLNGMIDVESELGKGTILKLKIPLTLAIIQALIVGVQEEYYAIPLSSVLETVRISQDEVYIVEGKSVLRLRDEILTLVRLSDIFKINDVIRNSNELYVVVVGLAENKIGIVVDYLVGQEEVVIKSLGYYLKGTEGIAGATVRGDGKITLIVDVAGMMNMAKYVKGTVNNLQEDEIELAEKTKPSDYVVLSVDDSHTDRMIIKKYLKPLGVTIIEATNGLEALEIIKNGDYHIDAVLVDIEMPRMDGYTLATEIRKYNKFKNLPLIAVTSRSAKTDRMRGVESGMTEYITKPYSAEYLLNVVKRNINFNIIGVEV
ncbi:chemotaxis protein CheW [Helicobacter sp. MIT 14-3879]|uniref:hybrid sensor histidine kinase/response regulator n=1 Tax=Helicobacter sp. MIT 14-3879 TaxID=2040649 RepID=UPI000E1EAA46|nr:chemotaxis protein CheW [Helicobacter sp. MIT 14-3879]RDU64713.1 hybrid sensor histidine kinase/response regulator [Helicobacter sp. MIT 14-3879]